MSRNVDDLMKIHKLRSLSELIVREPRLAAELDVLGIDTGQLSRLAWVMADEIEGKSLDLTSR